MGGRSSLRIKLKPGCNNSGFSSYNIYNQHTAIMNVAELIAKLKNCPQEALVIMTVGNEDKDIFSSSQFDVFGENEDKEYIELFMSDDAPQQL